MTGIGGSESSSKHMRRADYGRRQRPGAVDVPAMAEQSHRDEMSAAIRAQRERNAAPRTIAPEPARPAVHEPEQPVEAPPRGAGFLRRLRGKSS